AYLPDLATSVNNLAIRLAEAGRRPEALTTAEEAVTLRRELAAANRDAYLPDLAMSVNNLAVDLAEAGRRPEALTTAEEATDLYRELAEREPNTFADRLAATQRTVSYLTAEPDSGVGHPAL
nr:tetratricopeptide repeat protein [Actinomycetota bacterium]